LKLEYDEPLSSVAFNFNLRRYSEALRTELAALRDRLRYAGAAYAQRIGGGGGGDTEDDAEARVAGASTRPLLSST